MTTPSSQRLLLTLIIPAFDESKSIAQALAVTCRYFDDQGINFEILVVDDGSLDDTPAQVGAFSALHPQVQLLRHNTNLGKGAAVRTGMLRGEGEYMIFTDADMSYAVEDIGTMLEILRERADVAIGSRALHQSHTVKAPPVLRSLLSQIFGLAVQMIAIRGIADTQCGFKGFTRQAAAEIFPRVTITGFAFDVEVLVLARSLGYRIQPVPVHYVAREESKVRVLPDSLRMLGQLFRIRLNKWSGKYTRGKNEAVPGIGNDSALTSEEK